MTATTPRAGQAAATGRGEPQTSAPERARELLRRGFGLIGPRHPRHSVDVDQLDTLALPVADDGVVIGVDAENRPAVLGLNRPLPYDVVLIGGLWTVQVIALRAAATGTRVAVETARAQAWMPMVHAMGAVRTGWPCTTSGGCRRWVPRPVRRCWWYGTAGCGHLAVAWPRGLGSRF